MAGTFYKYLFVFSFIGFGCSNVQDIDLDVNMEEDIFHGNGIQKSASFNDEGRMKEMRKGIDLATTLERIKKNFVITDPRLPDNPIVRLSIFHYELCLRWII